MPSAEATLIRERREQRGYSIRQAARRAGISEGSWRRTETQPDVNRTAITVARMAAAVGILPAELSKAGRPDAAAALEKITERRLGDAGLPRAELAGPEPGTTWETLLGQILETLDDISADERLGSGAKRELREEYIAGMTRDAAERRRQLRLLREVKGNSG